MKQLITAYFLLIFSGVSAQKETVYHKGLIVTVTDDTIECLVPLVQNFGTAVITKKTANSPYDTIPISRIKYLANGMQVYETISFNTAKGMMQQLMWLKQEGTINLYELIYNDDTFTGYRETGTTRVYSYGRGEEEYMVHGVFTKDAPVVVYVIRKNDQTYLLSDKYFKEVVGPLVADKPPIADEVNSKKYSLKSIERLVEVYNTAE